MQQTFTALDEQGVAYAAELDPALLAFVKCHVTSVVAWVALRYVAEREGRWVGAEDVARVAQRPRVEVDRVMHALSQDGVVDEIHDGNAEDARYRLPHDEPTTIVLQRLVQATMRSPALRSVIAASVARGGRVLKPVA
ncbi:MAG: hypothetical protein HYX52_02655 [Chloroflexi bacterium]|nr:hypothetical protein [Chloroflexota bacterium]